MTEPPKVVSDNPDPKRLHPFCERCGWRKGGVDSWNGHACKCGWYEPPMRRIPDTEEEADEAADNGRNTGGKSYR
jgi:hypothetical protein